MRRGLLFLFLFGLIAPAVGLSVHAQPLRLILPTDNDALLYGDGPAFFQYTNRYFNGVRSRPWEGGQYGFVRNAKYAGDEIVYTRFHEGVDIKPLYRDRRGEPLDEVRAIDEGKVVYANPNARASSYGKYVVVEHWWSGSPFYSLYAHLGSVHVRAGQYVRQGDQLGVVGYTGRGIDRTRAHLHFEINMLLNQDYDDWNRRYNRRAGNPHGRYNGLNLAGINVAELYLALQNNPDLTIRQFLSREEAFFTVRIPNDHLPDLLYRYPWLADEHFDPHARSLEIGFTASGLPVRISSTNAFAKGPIVFASYSGPGSYADLTNHLTQTRWGDPILSASGQRYIGLLMMPTADTRSGRVPRAEPEERKEDKKFYPLARPVVLPVHTSVRPPNSSTRSDVAEDAQAGELDEEAADRIRSMSW